MAKSGNALDSILTRLADEPHRTVPIPAPSMIESGEALLPGLNYRRAPMGA